MIDSIFNTFPDIDDSHDGYEEIGLIDIPSPQDVTFTGSDTDVNLAKRYAQIDDLYNPDLERALEQGDVRDFEFWRDARNEAYRQAERDQAQMDYYNTLWELNSIQSIPFKGNLQHPQMSDVSFEGTFGDIMDGDTLPVVNEGAMTNFIQLYDDPFGLYCVEHGLHLNHSELEVFETPLLLETFTEQDIQDVSNMICDVVHWEHLPISIEDAAWNPNAAYSPGLFTHATFDDRLFINPNYAHECINQLGTTGIIISDIGHEIGHSIATNICGHMGTYLDEKIADFISGFIDGKLGINIDVARKWFEWQYDNQGINGYPISEDRWAAQAAGYYFSHWANGDDLQRALQDISFVDMIREYGIQG